MNKLKCIMAMVGMTVAGSAFALTQEPDTVAEPSVNLDDFVVTSQKKVIKSQTAPNSPTMSRLMNLPKDRACWTHCERCPW